MDLDDRPSKRPNRQQPSARTRAVVATSLLWFASLMVGCTDDVERTSIHLENAREHLSERNEADAILELRNALMLSPGNVDANNALGEIELQAGRYKAAIAHIEAAYRADPKNHRSALNLARVLVLKVENLEFAEQLLDAALAQQPDDAAAYIVRSNLEIARGQIRAALVAAKHAQVIAPEDPSTSWQLGHVFQARIAEALLEGRVTDPKVYERAFAAFEDYVELGGQDPWNADLERGRVMAAWPGRAAEAGDLYRAAVERAFAEADAKARARTVWRAVKFAHKQRDDELIDWSLSKLLELQPDDLRTSVALVQVRKRRGLSAESILQQLLERRPTDPEAHIEYARHLIATVSLTKGLAYLEEKAGDSEQDTPVLLGAITNTYFAAKQPAQAERTLARLEQEYPRHPRTVLERAQAHLKAGSPGKAAKALRGLIPLAPSFEAYRLLALSEEAIADVPAAIDAIERAIEMSPSFQYDEEILRARLLAKQRSWRQVINALKRISERAPPTNEQLVLLARARYATEQPMLGRALLERLIAEPSPPQRAVIEYGRREGLAQDPAVRQRAYAALEDLLKRSPRHVAATEQLARIEALTGKVELAASRLATLTRPSASALLLRGTLHASAGEIAAAHVDAREAFRINPKLPGAAEFLASLHLERGEGPAAIKILMRASSLDALGADGHLTLGRMYREAGENRLALASFQQALAKGSTEPILKNDIAYLLASLEQNLGQALRLAKEARVALGDDPNAVDTLGYVYLRIGAPKVALAHFEDAVARAPNPQADFYYHLGLALQSLDRNAEAATAFERALHINASFREAAEARRALETSRSALDQAPS